MYGSYFILFCSLFLNKYFGPEKSSPTSSKKPTKASGVDSPPAGPPLHEGAAKSATGSKANGSQNGGSRSGNSNVSSASWFRCVRRELLGWSCASIESLGLWPGSRRKSD